jgi:hypothetical protein
VTVFLREKSDFDLLRKVLTWPKIIKGISVSIALVSFFSFFNENETILIIPEESQGINFQRLLT